MNTLAVLAFPWWLGWSHMGTPIIAIVTAYVAVQQYLVNRRQYRLALFERRMVVFNRTMEMIASVNADANASLQDCMKFMRDTRDHELLFGPEVGKFINEVYRGATKLHAHIATDYSGTAEQQGKLLDWFAERMGECRKVFLKYLDFRTP
jgi:hypothetical protein